MLNPFRAPESFHSLEQGKPFKNQWTVQHTSLLIQGIQSPITSELGCFSQRHTEWESWGYLVHTQRVLYPLPCSLFIGVVIPAVIVSVNREHYLCPQRGQILIEIPLFPTGMKLGLTTPTVLSWPCHLERPILGVFLGSTGNPLGKKVICQGKIREMKKGNI